MTISLCLYRFTLSLLLSFCLGVCTLLKHVIFTPLTQGKNFYLGRRMNICLRISLSSHHKIPFVKFNFLLFFKFSFISYTLLIDKTFYFWIYNPNIVL